jgi:acetyl esterase/lipase
MIQDQDPVRYRDLVFDRVERTNDIVYGSAIDKPSGRSVDLKLDVYEPAGDSEKARPVYIFLFGGGFVQGNKEFEPRQYCELMARRGYVAVAISYRINQGNIATDGIPAAVSDTRQALRWLRSEAATHRLDTSRIILGGSSAGAIASLFTAYTEIEKTGADADSKIALVMDLWGGLYTAVNDMETGEPPLIIIHGTADTVVPFSEATKLRDRAEAVDIPYAFHPLQGEGHAPYKPAELMILVANFAYDRLWGQAPLPTAEPSQAPEPTALPSATPEPSATASPVLPTAAPSAAPTLAPRFEIFLPWLQRGDR